MLAVAEEGFANVIFGTQLIRVALFGLVLRIPPIPLRVLVAARGQRVATQEILEARVTQEEHLLGYLEPFPVGLEVMLVVAVLGAVVAQGAVPEGLDFPIAGARKVVSPPQVEEVLGVMEAETALLDALALHLFLVGVELEAVAQALLTMVCPRYHGQIILRPAAVAGLQVEETQ